MFSPEVDETAAKPPLVLLQKHLLGGCTIDMPSIKQPLTGRHIVSLCDTMLNM